MTPTTDPAMSRRSLGLDPAVALGLAAAIVFFLVSGAVAFFNLQALREGTQRIVQTHQTIVALDQMLSSVQDAETGQRGFLLTNDQRYLEPYNAALRAIPPKLDEIEELSGGTAAQRPRVSALRHHVEAKLAELRETIELRRSEASISISSGV